MVSHFIHVVGLESESIECERLVQGASKEKIERKARCFLADLRAYVEDLLEYDGDPVYTRHVLHVLSEAVGALGQTVAFLFHLNRRTFLPEGVKITRIKTKQRVPSDIPSGTWSVHLPERPAFFGRDE